MSDINLIADASALLNLYQTQYTQTDKLWGYFTTITLAILGFAIGSEKATKTLKESSLIVGGYIIFCIGNYSALSKAQEQLIVFASHATEYSIKAGIPFTNLHPFNVEWLSYFYFSVVASVSASIIAINRWRNKNT